jgi:signal transduction histidine kinase
LEVQAEHLTNTRIADLSRKQLAALGFVANSPEPLTILQASGPRPPSSIYTYQDFFLERGSAPLYDEQGNVLGWVIVVRDVTEQERTEQARSLITETVVHDLRSPIGAVQTTLDFLEDILSGESTDEAVLSSLNIAKRSTQRVLQLIGSLLDIGRLESGNMKLLIRSVNMYGLTNAVVHELQPQAQNLELSLHNHIFEGLPNVSADQGSISRVLYNLIDNALKFTPAGGSITIEAHAETEGELTISVTDTGPGVPLKYREEIFNRFSQVPNQRGRRRGTGLGLTFCRLAVEAHGGSIWLESGPAGIGSRFRFSLPLAESED